MTYAELRAEILNSDLTKQEREMLRVELTRDMGRPPGKRCAKESPRRPFAMVAADRAANGGGWSAGHLRHDVLRDVRGSAAIEAPQEGRIVAEFPMTRWTCGPLVMLKALAILIGGIALMLVCVTALALIDSRAH